LLQFATIVDDCSTVLTALEACNQAKHILSETNKRRMQPLIK